MATKSSTAVVLSLPTPVLTFLKWLELTTGRDKVYRFVAYFSKFVVQQMKQNNISPDWQERLTKGGSTIGQTRKLIRFFRSLEYLQEFLKSIQLRDDTEKYISMFKNLSLGIWMAADHAQWLHKAGYLKLNDSIKRIDEIHSKSWFWGLAAGILLCAYKMKLIADEQNNVQDQLRSTGGNVSAASNKQLAALEDKRNKQIQGIIKNSIDIVIPAARLNWLPVSDGTVGLAGTITSIIGMYDTWPASK